MSDAFPWHSDSLAASVKNFTKENDNTLPSTGAASNGTTSVSSRATSAASAVDSASSGQKGMSAGAIAGTVVGVVVGVLLFAALVTWFLWKRRRRPFAGDLDEGGDETKPTPYFAPAPVPSSGERSAEGHDAEYSAAAFADVDADGKAQQPLQPLQADHARPHSQPQHPERIVHHEQDAGALAQHAPPQVDVLPPMYNEEWNAQGGPSSPAVSSHAAGPLSSPSSIGSPGITAEEIKFLGAPLTPRLGNSQGSQGSQSSRHALLDSASTHGMTSKERELLGTGRSWEHEAQSAAKSGEERKYLASTVSSGDGRGVTARPLPGDAWRPWLRGTRGWMNSEKGTL